MAWRGWGEVALWKGKKLVRLFQKKKLKHKKDVINGGQENLNQLPHLSAASTAKETAPGRSGEAKE